MKILVINAGSSSLKYQLIDMDDESVIAKGICERIGNEGSCISGKIHGKSEKFEKTVVMKNHTEAFNEVKKALTEGEYKVINDISEIAAVGHRIVQGGALFNHSVLVDDDVIKGIESLCDLAPLHNAAHIQGIKASIELFGKDVPQVVVFDNAFHSTMPPEAYMFGLPYEYYEKYALRKYGFHGTSHRFVSARCADVMGEDIKKLKIVTCHLGNGSSITAVKYGKCIDTSMGLTPLEGLIMGTRSGDLDPAIIEYLCNHENLTVSEMLNILNKKSGVLGMSGGISSDFRDLNAAANEGNEVAKVTLEAYAYRAAMNGVDAITFTAGVGENAAWLRPMVCKYLGFLGVELDEAASQKACGVEGIISTPESKVKLCVIPTNEELAIARETLALVK